TAGVDVEGAQAELRADEVGGLAVGGDCAVVELGRGAGDRRRVLVGELEGLQVPDDRRAVVPAGDGEVSVAADGDGGDRAGVPVELVDNALRLQVHDEDLAADPARAEQVQPIRVQGGFVHGGFGEGLDD